ncbi:MAG: hypothetical protein Q9184_007433 [Pyrenodesmia sp. 2 TL-2023]
MQVALWGLAELATVVLCGSAIFIPRFFQAFRGKSNSYPGTRAPHSRTMLNSYDGVGRRWHSKIKGPGDTPYDVPGSAGTQYIQLEDRQAIARSSQAPGTASGLGPHTGIMRTIQIETKAEALKGVGDPRE